MPRRRSAETMERDHQAYDLFRRGLSYRQIAAQQGYRSHNAAFEAVRRAAREAVSDPLEQAEARQAFLDRFQDYRRAAQRVLTARHYVTTQSGKVVTGPDGGPLLDDDPVLRALDRLVKIDDIEARLRDLYPPAKSKVEVITSDMIESKITELEAQLALNDPAHTGPAGPPALPA